MPEQSQTIIFLVRHGATNHGYDIRANKDSSRQLTAQGEKQSRLVGRYLDQFQPTIIFSSPLDRCQETAAIIRQEVELKPGTIVTDRLREIYSPEPRLEAGERGRSIFKTILDDYPGQQVVAVTHQYIIGYAVAEFLGVSYREVPCDFADVYRLVFAGQTLVEATRLQPAKDAL